MARKRKSVKRHKKKSLSNYIAAGVSAFVVIALIGIGVAYKNVSSDIFETDKDTLCRVDGKFSTNVMLIDITDGYNQLQLKNMRLKIADIVANLNKYDQLQLFFLKDDINASLTPEIVACNPGTGEGVSKLYANPKLMERKWKEKFENPLNDLVNFGLDRSSMASYGKSPIMEIIQSINSSTLSPIKGDKTFIVFSDMIQNSNNFSFFKERDVSIDKRANTLFNSEYFNRVKTDLKNIHVDIYYTYRDKYERLQSKDHIEFWKTYFIHNGAKKVSFTRIEG